MAATMAAAQGATAADSVTAMPDDTAVLQALRDTPPVRAATQLVEAETAVLRQYRASPHEWTATANAARRNQTGPTPENTVEWDIGLERAFRLPGKTATYERAGGARLAQARLVLRKAWSEQARALLERQATWLRERAGEGLWQQQAELMRRQLQAVSRRQSIGDAARVDIQQAAAAVAQAEAQLAASAGRQLAAIEALRRLFPTLQPRSTAAAAAPSTEGLTKWLTEGLTEWLAGDETEWVAAQLRHSPELSAAQGEAALAQAMLAVDRVESRPDPTVGLRVGRARSGAEQTVGLVFSLPFAGEYRAAGAMASAARAEAARYAQQDVQRRVEVEARQRLRDAQTAHATWQRNEDAAQALGAVADSLARGYQLGEGSLAELLAARRLANDQKLAAAMGAVDAWLARQRLLLEAGQLWPWPGPDAFSDAFREAAL